MMARVPCQRNQGGEDRYPGPELDLHALVQYPRGSLGYTYAKVLKRLGYNAHFYTDRKSRDAETDYVSMRMRKTHDLQHIVTVVRRCSARG